MKTGLRHILCIVCLIMASFSLRGQNQSDSDVLLNRYELLCAECVSLRSKVNAGEKVSRKQAKDMLDAFVKMNGEIKSAADSLSDEQKRRFEAVNRWFATGVRPLMLSHQTFASCPKALQAPKVTTEITIPWPAPQTESVSAPQENHFFRPRYTVLASVSYPDASFGAMFGIQARSKAKGKATWGGYVHFKSNFDFSEPSYFCSGDGILENGGAFWPSGDKQNSTLKVTGGILAGVNRWLNIYAGLGYGYKRLYWEDIDGQWAQVRDFSYAGLASEAGLIFSWRHISVGAGISTIGFRTPSFDLSVGISF